MTTPEIRPEETGAPQGCGCFNVYAVTSVVIAIYMANENLPELAWIASFVFGMIFLFWYGSWAAGTFAGIWTFFVASLCYFLSPTVPGYAIVGIWALSQPILFVVSKVLSEAFNALAIVKESNKSYVVLYKSYLRRRDYFFRNWIRYKALNALIRINTPEALDAVAQTLVETDNEALRDSAYRAVERATDPKLLDAACAVWERTRDPRLLETFRKKKWKASSPSKIRLALKLNRLDKAKGRGAKSVGALLECAEDADEQIAANARHALSELTDEESREEICRAVLENENACARALALEKEYAPADEKNRAYFFFVTEQWERYDALDFDRNLTRAVYDSGNDDTRQRIRERVKRLGKMDLLPIITGVSMGIENEDLSVDEYGTLAETLLANQDWERLWKRVDDFPFIWSIRAIDAMWRNDWKPREKNDRELFDELVGYVQNELESVEEKDLSELFPPAMVKIQARGKDSVSQIADLAFSPLRPSIAVATFFGNILLWNYNTTKQERLIKGLSPSIGRVLLTEDDTLLCVNGSTVWTRSPSIYGWKDPWGKAIPFQLVKGLESKTEIALVGRAQALSVDWYGNVALWDLDAQKEILHRSLSYGEMNYKICVSPDGKRALLYDKNMTLISLSNLREESAPLTIVESLQAATFSPDGSWIFAGTKQGKVLSYDARQVYDARILNAQKSPWTEFKAGLEKVVAVETLKDLPVAIAIGSGGEARFFSTKDRTLLGSISSSKGHIRAARLNQDETLLGVLETDATFSLWDLYPLAIRTKINGPLARFDSSIMKPLNAVLKQQKLDPRVRAAWSFMRGVLGRRFQYEIEVDEAPTMPSGEFDIEVGEL